MNSKRIKVAAIALLLLLSTVVSIALPLNETTIVSAAVKSMPEVLIAKGKTQKLVLEGAKASQIKWKTSNKKIATVSKGTVKGIKAGTAKITATYQGKKYTWNIAVYTDQKKNAGNYLYDFGVSYKKDCSDSVYEALNAGTVWHTAIMKVPAGLLGNSHDAYISLAEIKKLFPQSHYDICCQIIGITEGDISSLIFGERYAGKLNVVYDKTSSSYIICADSTQLATLASNGAVMVAGQDGTIYYLEFSYVEE